ncbi:MAG: hypothetical protein JSS51_04480, partial [Planctomycetes bacterium]|nr:hypothetical protein [Planctomycetota bacterium]
SLAFNLNLQQLTGDVSEGASLPGINGPILAVYYSDSTTEDFTQHHHNTAVRWFAGLTGRGSNRAA